ncbi:MAG: hypothetical protein EZS28_040264 [Streblomastix strix]|uniref:Uncharacterized protein n=1 Tax=Streblomastix strix TaxID=222440 RepID=A0A5J4U1H4_9EUKA|nr:MAG: hypothetical protein EZS28_040264 [Streblomastix strix]
MFYLKLSLKELLLQSLVVSLSITIYYTPPFEVFLKINLGVTTFPVILGPVEMSVLGVIRLVAANQYITEIAKQHSRIEILNTEQMVIDNITVDIIIDQKVVTSSAYAIEEKVGLNVIF